MRVTATTEMKVPVPFLALFANCMGRFVCADIITAYFCGSTPVYHCYITDDAYGHIFSVNDLTVSAGGRPPRTVPGTPWPHAKECCIQWKVLSGTFQS